MPQIDIKITSLADLKGFLDVTRAAKDTRKEVSGFGDLVRSGLGIGSGIELARRGFEFLKASVVDSVRESFALAGQIKDGAEALGISLQAYQVFGEVMRDVGGDQERMTQAIAANNRALVEARSLVGPAAAAFRTLGLDPAQLEGLSVQKRLEVIGRAIDGAKDKTLAFSAAGDILGSKNLPTLLNALRVLGVEGYDNLAEKAESAGRVMSDDTIERLDRANKAIEKWKNSMTIAVGETIGGIDKIKEAAKAKPSETFFGLLSGGLTGNFGSLAATVALNTKEPEKKNAPGEDPAILAANQAAAEAKTTSINAQRDAERDLTKAKLDQQRVDTDNKASDSLKDRLTLQNIQKEFTARAKIIDLLEKTPIEGNESIQGRETKLNQLRTENALLLQRKNIIETGPRSAADKISEGAAGVNDPRRNPNFLTAGEGVAAGLEQQVASIGSIGEQVAASINDSVGGAVSNISSGIQGWINGTESWVTTLRNVGQSILGSMLQTIVQMGAQWLINSILIKTGMFSIEATGDALRASRVVKENAAEAATLPLKTAGAAASGISSFGVALAFGALAVGLIFALAGGFADGGYTPGGPKNKLVGGVHAGEWVAPQWQVNHPVYGPMIAMLEGARTGVGGFLDGGLVAASLTRPGFAPAANAAGADGTAAGSTGRPVNIFPYFDMDELKRAVRDSDGDAHIVSVMQANRHLLGI